MGLGRSSESSEQIAAYGVEQVVAVEVQVVDEAWCRGRAVDLGHRDRSVECGDRAGVETRQLVIERDPSWGRLSNGAKVANNASAN